MAGGSLLLMTVLPVGRQCRWSREIVPEFYARPPEVGGTFRVEASGGSRETFPRDVESCTE
jgi:hypothetical protein